MSVVSWAITAAAIAAYLVKILQAQAKMREAKKKMDAAAQKLCSVWAGQSAEAFAAEQKVLANYCDQLFSVGDDYAKAVESMQKEYEAAEERVLKALKA